MSEDEKMNGEKLLNAATIIVKAGAQIEALIEKLAENLKEKIDSVDGLRCSLDKPQYEYCDANEWLVGNAFRNIEINEGRKTNSSKQLAFQVILYNSEDSELKNWQPAIYIMYAPGIDEPFEPDSILLTDQELKPSINQDEDRIVRWDEDVLGVIDSWFFVVPLVRINNEADISEQIVEPAIKLLKQELAKQEQEATEQTEVNIFPKDSIAFRFFLDGEGNLQIKD